MLYELLFSAASSRIHGEYVTKSSQRGDFILWMSAVLMLVTVSWTVYDLLPADVEEVQAVVVRARANAEAKAALATAFAEIPNPDRIDLRRMRRQVDEILVTETARALTGDRSLQTPSALAVIREKDDAAQMAAIESKTWRHMSDDERIAFLTSAPRLTLVALVLVVAGSAVFGWRAIFSASGRH